jgi:hypothetical protein
VYGTLLVIEGEKREGRLDQRKRLNMPLRPLICSVSCELLAPRQQMACNRDRMPSEHLRSSKTISVCLAKKT